MTAAYSIQDLVRETGLSDRTIKFYIAEGLVDRPESTGRYATYSQKHLDRLKLIADLAEQGFKLAAIKTRLNQELNAASYVRSALEAMNLSPTIGAGATDIVVEPAVIEPMRDEALEAGDMWRRVGLTEGVELHCRQPLTDEMDEIVEITITFFREQLERTRERRG